MRTVSEANREPASDPTRKRWSHDTREEVDKLVAALDDARQLFA